MHSRVSCVPFRSIIGATLMILGLSIIMPDSNAFAQDVRRETPAQAPSRRPVVPAGDGVLHVTDRLDRSQAARQALQEFHLDRATGRSDAPRIQTVLQPGARATFRVMKNISTNPTWEEREFVLKGSGDVAYIWVEQGELDLGHVDDTDVTTLESALFEQTPAGSANSGRGIVENNNVYFGSAPDTDGDGLLDILLYDIEEGTSSSNSYIAGFVTSADLAPSGGGNNKDILYLDTHPGVSSRPIESVLSTAAHEYQHLIHYNYDSSNLELTFVNEGLSEWAEVLNGYPARTMAFLQDPLTYNVPIFGWETGDDVLNDYQRAGLFTGYLAERLGPVTTASITRNSGRGRTGYESVLTGAGLAFNEVLKDYHTANFINDAGLDVVYGYRHIAFAGVGRITYTAFDGRNADVTPGTTVYVEPGSAAHLVWKNVTDFSFDLDTVDAFATLRNRIAVRVLSRKNGLTFIVDLTLPIDGEFFEGTFDEIALLAIHVQPELTSRVGINYDASWSNTIGGTLSSITFDDGAVVSGTFFSLSAGANGAVATRFDSPAPGRTRLLELSVAPFYLNQFDSESLTPDAPRDLTVKLWRVGIGGLPGDEIFSLEIEDPRPYTAATATLSHFSVDLAAYEEELDNLPDAFYAGYGEAGTDQNYMVVGPSLYPDEDISYVSRSNGQWGSLWQTQFSGEPEDPFPLNGTVVPVRAVFEVLSEPVSTQDPLPGPRQAALAQNYPNPFNRSTSIGYTVPQPGPVKITLYNVVGQQLDVLIDRFHDAGEYVVTLHAETLPSGLYLYRLDTAGKTLSKRMTVVR